MSHVSRLARVASAIGCPLSFDRAKILDLGCGNGAAVAEERATGIDAFGCDMSEVLGSAPKNLIQRGILRPIDMDSYRIPFKNDKFDMVVSNEVFEHVRDYEETLREIRRVLKPGGVSIHVFPSRHTPVEPHVFVPLATIIQSTWWLLLWAHLGIRNEFQQNLAAKEVAKRNHQYLATCTNYLTRREIREQVAKSFATISFVEKEYLAAGSRYGPLIARVPFAPAVFGELVQRVIALR